MVRWNMTQSSSDVQGVIQNTVYEASINAAAVEQTRDTAAVHSVLAPAPHLEPASFQVVSAV